MILYSGGGEGRPDRRPQVTPRELRHPKEPTLKASSKAVCRGYLGYEVRGPNHMLN